MSLHVTIVIVGFRNAQDIVRCVAALEASTHADFDVVICENGGPEACGELLTCLPRALPGKQAVRIIEAPGNIGFAGGVNLGLGASRHADAWWVLNPDTQPDPGALAALAARLARGDCEAVGGVLYLPNGRVQAYGGRWRGWLARPESIGYGRPHGETIDPAAIERSQSFLLGASMLISRRFLDTVGPMREDYFLYCEETEWCLRGTSRGMRLGFAPDSGVRHESGATTGAGKAVTERPRLPVYLGERNKILLTRDRFPHRLAVAATSALVLIVLRYARARAWAQFGHALSGWWAGLRDERGPPAWLGAS
jgi:GT2 family glycosyltransferase